MEVSFQEILDARERRVVRQQTLLAKHPVPLLCFTMNIAGPEKNNPLISAGFQMGLELLDAQLASDRIPVLERQVFQENTGCEAFYSVMIPAEQLKRLAVQIEDHTPAGRLYDMDVLTKEGKKISRESLDLPGRTCLICGGPVHICSRSRAHTAEKLQEVTATLLQNALWQKKAETIGALAIKSLLFEVCTTPKPGLVDRRNNGSHKDMDIFTFMGSCAALMPYFTACAFTGLQGTSDDPKTAFEKLRFLGKQAEQTMFAATKGVNTHKGAIFTLGLLCAAAGKSGNTNAADICAQVAAMTEGITNRNDIPEEGRTAGERLYSRYGITGIRGQAESGLPVLLEVGLPRFNQGLARGLSLEEAGSAVLLHLMCAVTDTNLIARSDLATQQAVCNKVRRILAAEPFPTQDTLEKLDAEFTRENLSPGGSADLLAATYFLHFCQTDL